MSPTHIAHCSFASGAPTVLGTKAPLDDEELYFSYDLIHAIFQRNVSRIPSIVPKESPRTIVSTLVIAYGVGPGTTSLWLDCLHAVKCDRLAEFCSSLIATTAPNRQGCQLIEQIMKRDPRKPLDPALEQCMNFDQFINEYSDETKPNDIFIIRDILPLDTNVFSILKRFYRGRVMDSPRIEPMVKLLWGQYCRYSRLWHLDELPNFEPHVVAWMVRLILEMNPSRAIFSGFFAFAHEYLKESEDVALHENVLKHGATKFEIFNIMKRTYELVGEFRVAPIHPIWPTLIGLFARAPGTRLVPYMMAELDALQCMSPMTNLIAALQMILNAVNVVNDAIVIPIPPPSVPSLVGTKKFMDQTKEYHGLYVSRFLASCKPEPFVWYLAKHNAAITCPPRDDAETLYKLVHDPCFGGTTPTEFSKLISTSRIVHWLKTQEWQNALQMLAAWATEFLDADQAHHKEGFFPSFLLPPWLAPMPHHAVSKQPANSGNFWTCSAQLATQAPKPVVDELEQAASDSSLAKTLPELDRVTPKAGQVKTEDDLIIPMEIVSELERWIIESKIMKKGKMFFIACSPMLLNPNFGDMTESVCTRAGNGVQCLKLPCIRVLITKDTVGFVDLVLSVIGSEMGKTRLGNLLRYEKDKFLMPMATGLLMSKLNLMSRVEHYKCPDEQHDAIKSFIQTDPDMRRYYMCHWAYSLVMGTIVIMYIRNEAPQNFIPNLPFFLHDPWSISVSPIFCYAKLVGQTPYAPRQHMEAFASSVMKQHFLRHLAEYSKLDFDPSLLLKYLHEWNSPTFLCDLWKSIFLTHA